MAPGTFTDVTPSRLSTTPDWLAALFVHVSLTDVGPAAVAVRFEGAAGIGVSLGAAFAGGPAASRPMNSAATAVSSSVVLMRCKLMTISPLPRIHHRARNRLPARIMQRS